MKRRPWWWLTPLGRVRIALADAEQPADPACALRRLCKALAVLRGPRRAGRAGTAELLQRCLERVIDLALRLGDLSRAATGLRQLEGCTSAERCLDRRYGLVVAARAAGSTATAIEQARLYVGNACSDGARVAGLLRWALTASPDGARPLALAVHRRFRQSAETETLRQLCLAPDRLDDAAQAEVIAAATLPESLAAWQGLCARAHGLRARCAAAGGRWAEMLTEAQAALVLDPGVRSYRYWAALALLRNDRAAEALAGLPGAADRLPEEQRLATIATLTAEPELRRVEDCLRALEGALRPPSGTEADLALAALRRALRPDVGDPRERLLEIRRSSERVERAAGRLPWSEYNIAVAEACAEADFARAQKRLAALDETAAPEGGCPAFLLRGACAAILGRGAILRDALAAGEVGDGDFARDEELLQAVLAAFMVLCPPDGGSSSEAAPPPGAETRLASLAAVPGRLARALPALAGLAAVLADVMQAPEEEGGAVAPPVGGQMLAASPWAAWVWERLRLASAMTAGIMDALTPRTDEACHPALVWERVVWRQELAAVAPAAHSTLGEDLESLAGSLSGQSGSPWRRLLQLRQGLTRISADESGGELIEWSAVAAPWFPADSPLQRPLQCEARADLHYLEGRRWLRSGAPQRALERFRRAREALGGEGPARFLAKLRLASVLAYWEGVALAHLGRLEEARDCLVPCRRGVKAIEAEVQLGMLALSAGDTAAASECLARVPQPLPPPACYLAALVAEREGRADETQQEVDRALAAGPSPRGVYAAAAWRLHGRLAEREGRAEEAAEAYRQALDRWPADRAAIVRLGRVRLRTELPRLGTGAAWRHDPALAALGEAASAIAWARPMAELREWLLAAEPGEEMHPPLPGAPAGRRRRSSRTRRDGARPPLPPQPAGPALERLALRLLLGAGRRREAAERASAWCATDHEDLALAAAAAVLATALVLQSGAASGGAPARWAAVEGLAGRLASLRLKGVSDPAVSFWHDATRLALAPELAATGELCVAAPADGGPPQRAAFAAVVRLFSSDAEWRRNAAEACRELLAEGAFAERSQHDAVAFLVAMAGADDDELVARYTAVEAHLETVPCVASDAYVTASEARLRSGAVDAVTHGAIPDSLAELDDPEVRRVVGLAYALRAARRAERDPRGALNEAGQAIELLTAKG